MRFATAASLLGELATIDSDSLLQRKLRFYARQQLLMIDEVGYLSYSNGDVQVELDNERQIPYAMDLVRQAFAAKQPGHAAGDRGDAPAS